MREYSLQVLLATHLLATVRCHFYFPGFQYQPPQPQPGFRYELRAPTPPLPPTPPLLVNPETIPQYQQLLPYPSRPLVPQYTPHVQPLHLYRFPEQTVVIPLKTFNGLPPFIERLVQRIQTYYSVYNPIESLTRPPPYNPSTTAAQPANDMETSDPPQDKPVQSVQVTTANKRPQEESTIVGEVTATTSKTTIKNKVSTLTVYEVQPSESTTVSPTTTTLSPDDEDTTIPPDIGGTTEEPNFISPENASVAAIHSNFKYESFPLDQFFYKPSSKRRS